VLDRQTSGDEAQPEGALGLHLHPLFFHPRPPDMDLFICYRCVYPASLVQPQASHQKAVRRPRPIDKTCRVLHSLIYPKPRSDPLHLLRSGPLCRSTSPGLLSINYPLWLPAPFLENPLLRRIFLLHCNPSRLQPTEKERTINNTARKYKKKGGGIEGEHYSLLFSRPTEIVLRRFTRLASGLEGDERHVRE